MLSIDKLWAKGPTNRRCAEIWTFDGVTVLTLPANLLGESHVQKLERQLRRMQSLEKAFRVVYQWKRRFYQNAL